MSARIQDDLSFVVSGDSRNSYYYDHVSEIWTKGPQLKNKHFNSAIGTLIDTVTGETLIAITGGFNSDPVALTTVEFLINQQWIEGAHDT